jgi:four helix bundle protein
MADTSIQNLRVYTLARELEDKVAALLPALPPEDLYTLNNDLRRSSAGVAHYIYDAHRRYSYTIKVDCLHASIAEAEHMKTLLATYETKGHGKTVKLQDDYTAIIKQCWGLLKYLRGKQLTQQTKETAKARDELVQARAA